MNNNHIRPDYHTAGPARNTTPEHALLYAVFETYFNDVRNVAISDIKLEALLDSARHPWTNYLCHLIGLEPGFLTRKLEQIAKELEPARRAFRDRRDAKLKEWIKEKE